ncbi:polysaccharide deacetylase family protein [Bradyrhizobium sp. 142]|uniref:polysaccharide deacetylase family protein n=1 Tax=Bradyrhizobium sp. 142 TaxID=2782618 RepID=UPI001FF90958|nr:polysaccharide deacetylase family protein [Bradyrhizobium sp. 142]MCK1730976.1 polysaccharide deacetylase family protein [Bradyrhizobium sp. 142]
MTFSGRLSDSDYLRYSAITRRSPVIWPGGAHVAFWTVPNVEHYEFKPVAQNPYIKSWSRTPAPDVMEYSLYDYGNRVGFWRMLEVYDRYNLKATVSVNVAVLEQFPRLCEAMIERNWEFMGHGLFNTRYLFGMDIEHERHFYRDLIRQTHERTGTRMKGMLGPALTATPNTPWLMKEAGLLYTTDWFVDDQPFPLFTPAGPLVGVPYSRTINDAFNFWPGTRVVEPEYWVQTCKDQFDVLFQEGAESGRVMCLPLHPFIVGQPHRVKYLDQILDYVLRHDHVWCATAGEIADWYAKTTMPRHIEELEPILKDAE